MKFLAVFFALGFALASAVPLPSNDNAVGKSTRALENFYLDLALEAEDDDVKTELGKKLKERFDEILEKLKEAIENGKTVKEETLDKLKEIKSKLKDLKVDLGDRAKDLLEKLKEKAKDYWKKILDKLNPESADVLYADDDTRTELGKKLKERFEEILEKVKEAIDNGKVVKEDYLVKLKELREKLKDMKVDLGKQAKDLIERLKEKAKDYWKKILDKLNPESAYEIHYADEDPKTELGKKLKEKFEEILEKVKEAIDNGRAVKEENLEKLKEIRQKLKDMKIDLGKQAKELIERLKEKAKEYWQKILDKLNKKDKRDVDEEDLNSQLLEQLKVIIDYDKDVSTLTNAIEEEKTSTDKRPRNQFMKVREQLRKVKAELIEKAKKLVEKLEEKAKDHWRQILDKYSKSKRDADDEDLNTQLLKKLKELLDAGETVSKLTNAIEGGKIIEEKLLNKLKEVREQYRKVKADLVEKTKSLVEKLKEKAKDYWHQILDKFAQKDKRDAGDEDLNTQLLRKFLEVIDYDKAVSRLTKSIEDGKITDERTLNRYREVREQWRYVKAEHIKKAKNLVEKLEEKVKDYWRQILDEFSEKKKRDADEIYDAEFNFRDIFTRLKELVKGKFDADELKEKVEKLFGKGSQVAAQLINMLNEKGEKGKSKILDFIDRILGKKEEKRSIKEVYEKVKNYFKELNIELKEKFTKFGEYVKEQYQKVLEKSKTKADSIKNIAKEFLEDSKKMSKEVAEEALEFFREYKEDLGNVFDDIKAKVKDVINKKD